jgi:hypothetical protein
VCIESGEGTSGVVRRGRSSAELGAGLGRKPSGDRGAPVGEGGCLGGGGDEEGEGVGGVFGQLEK